MPTPPTETAPELSVTGYPKGGRPAKVHNATRWHLIVDSAVRQRAILRAARRGEELTDVMRGLMADYAAGRIVPSKSPEETR